MPFLAPILGVVASGGWLTQLLVGAAFTLGGTLLQNLFKPGNTQKDPGVSLSIQIGGTSPLSFFVGTYASKGHRIYAGSWGQAGGTPNAYFADVLELSNAPADSLSGIYVEGELSSVLWDEPHPELGYPVAAGRHNGEDYLWIRFHDGRQIEADSYMRFRFGSNPDRPYSADMIGYGTAYVVVTTRYNREQFQGRSPSLLFQVRGLRLYDPRKDSTNGGTGTHRRNDPSTWEWSENPYVIAYNVVFMGVYVGAEWVWGLQNLPEMRLPLSAWVAAMNEADRTLPDWDNQVQFTVGAEVTVDTQPADFLEEIAKASLGKFIESAGSYKPRCGLPGAAVWSFGEGELLITDPRTITPFPGLEGTHNAIESTYVEPAEAWVSKAAPEASDAGYLAADSSRKLVAGLSYPLVNRNEQAQRLNFSYLHDGRRFRMLKASFHPLSWVLEPGDVIDGTILSEGFAEKSFEILEMSGRGTFVQTMTLREVDPSDFDPPADAWQPWEVSPIQIINPPAQPATGVSFDGYTFRDNENNARRPGIIAFYQGGMEDIQFFRVRVRRPGDATPFFEGDFPYQQNTMLASQPIFSEAFLPNMELEAQGQYIPYSTRETTPTSWLTVTTPNVKLVAGLDFDPYEGVIDFETLGPKLSGWIEWIGLSPRELLESIEDTNLNLADQGLSDSDRLRELRTEVAVTFGEVEANFEQIITVAIVPLQGEVAALADWVTTLSAGDGTDVSTARFRMTTLSGPSGYSRIGAETRVDTADPDAWRGAAWYLDTPNNAAQPTRFVVRADQFVVVNSADAGMTAPLIFDGTALRVANALVKEASIDNLAVTSAKIDNAAITNAKIGNLQVDTIKIANGAVTALLSTTGPDGSLTSNGTAVAADISITFPTYQSGPIILSAQVRFPAQNLGLSTGPSFGIAILRNGTALRGRGAPTVTGGSAITIGSNLEPVMDIQYIDIPPGPGSYTYTMRLTFTANSALVNYYDRRLVGSYAMK